MENGGSAEVTTVARKKLIEVALPLEVINKAGKAEKNRKTGTLRNIHKWFAPMPGPVWRALLAACVVDDPESDEKRQEILSLIEQLVPGDGGIPSHNAELIMRDIFKIAGQRVPEVVVVDPFVGGGSTLVEAQRLGLAALGGDLNPVPALISRTLVELFPSLPILDGPRLAEKLSMSHSQLESIGLDLRFLANEVRERALRKIGFLYPQVAGGIPYAYLWAHSIPCPNPACNVIVPLFATQALSKQRNLQAWLAFDVTDSGEVEFRVVSSQEESNGSTKASRGRFECPKCRTGFGVDLLKENSDELSLVPVALMVKQGDQRRMYGASEYPDAFVAYKIPANLHVTPLPDGGLGLTVQAYGFTTYEEMFTSRQIASVTTFAEVVADVALDLPARVASDKYAKFLTAMLGLCVGKLAHSNSKQSTWRIDSRNGAGKIEAGFGQSVLTMVWDFSEANPFGGSMGDWMQIVDTSLRGLDQLGKNLAGGRVVQAPAQSMTRHFSPNLRHLIATDPPYFDAIGYADLSDFFYIWHRDALRQTFPDLYQTASVPRSEELVSDRSRHGGDDTAATSFFVEGFRRTFESLVAEADDEFPMIIVYAHQQREEKLGEYGSSGWEALLESLIRSEIMVTASWPIHCTSQTRLRGQDSNALSAYVALVCRKRPVTSVATDRRGLIAALKAELPEALRAMRQASVAPIDLAQASIGPGMSVFSRFSRVIEADGSEMTVRTALSLINQILGEVLSEQEGDFDPETRFALKWFEQYQWGAGPYGQAESLSKAMLTSVEKMARAGVLRSGGGKVNLVDPDTLDRGWNPELDNEISLWEAMIQITSALMSEGELGASSLLVGVAHQVNIDRVKDLAFQMYGICERNSWSKSSQMFNALGASWNDLASAARRSAGRSTSLQGTLDLQELDQ